MEYKKNISKDFIPLLISILLVLASIGVTIFSKYTLNYKHYIGIGLIPISTILYFKNKKIFVYIFGSTLILGAVGQIDFYYVHIFFRIGVLIIQPIFLILFILFLVLNKKLIENMFPKKKSKEKSTYKKIADREKRIKNYEMKFQSKSESELRRISAEDSVHADEAKIASINILRKKNLL